MEDELQRRASKISNLQKQSKINLIYGVPNAPQHAPAAGSSAAGK